MPAIFPFTAIVGQERMKRALILNAINPLIGGVLIRGERGTAKSTAVRALAALLPEIKVVADCRFGCDPTGSHLCDECLEREARGEDALDLVPHLSCIASAHQERGDEKDTATTTHGGSRGT